MAVGFSTNWDDRYKENTHMSVWPWSDLVSMVYTYCQRPFQEKKVLELGCGAGANIPFLSKIGMEYYGVDGSATIIANLHERFPHLKRNLKVTDFTKDFSHQGLFDFIVDRAAITHNHTENIRLILQNVRGSLKTGGLFLGVDWFSTKHFEYSQGEPTDSIYARSGYVAGGFADVGIVHFADEELLRSFFQEGFELVSLAEKTRTEISGDDHRLYAAWDIVARKL
tara:strand:+ start:1524 stop:2198 length:675 start_codon:yes stop_codon:yes gene_type:complete